MALLMWGLVGSKVKQQGQLNRLKCKTKEYLCSYKHELVEVFKLCFISKGKDGLEKGGKMIHFLSYQFSPSISAFLPDLEPWGYLTSKIQGKIRRAGLKMMFSSLHHVSKGHHPFPYRLSVWSSMIQQLDLPTKSSQFNFENKQMNKKKKKLLFSVGSPSNQISP